MTVYGYARVSVREPEDKNLDLQVERLVRAGCSMGNIRAEEASPANPDPAEISIHRRPGIVAAKSRESAPESIHPATTITVSSEHIIICSYRLTLI